MCGIGGFVLQDKRKNLSKDLQVNALTMLMELQSRGEHAWGVYIEKHGEKPKLYCGKPCDNIKGELFKQPESVKSFFAQKDGKIYLDKTHTILMHTRASTHGDPRDNENNHPFNTDDFILAHNGVIRNQEEIYKKFNIKTNIECDSYAIISLIQHFYDKNGKKDIPKCINEASKYLKGSYACWLYDKQRGEIYLFRKTSPLEVYIDEDNSLLAFASEDKQIVNAYNDDNVKATNCKTITYETIYKIVDNDIKEVGKLEDVDNSWNRTRYNDDYSSKFANNYQSNQLIDTSSINRSLAELYQIFEWWDSNPLKETKTGIYICENAVVLLVSPEGLIEQLDKAGFVKYKSKHKCYNTSYWKYEIAPMDKLNSLVSSLCNDLYGKNKKKVSDVKDNDKSFEEGLEDLAETIECSFNKFNSKYIFEYQGEGNVPQWIKKKFKDYGLHFRKNNIMRVPSNNTNIKKLKDIMKKLKIYISD